MRVNMHTSIDDGENRAVKSEYFMFDGNFFLRTVKLARNL